MSLSSVHPHLVLKRIGLSICLHAAVLNSRGRHGGTEYDGTQFATCDQILITSQISPSFIHSFIHFFIATNVKRIRRYICYD